MMNGNIGNDDNENEKLPESFILITFAGVGSTLVNVQTNQVTPGQMVFIGEYLRVQGIRQMEIQLERQRQEETMKKVVSPEAKIFVPGR